MMSRCGVAYDLVLVDRSAGPRRIAEDVGSLPIVSPDRRRIAYQGAAAWSDPYGPPAPIVIHELSTGVVRRLERFANESQNPIAWLD